MAAVTYPVSLDTDLKRLAAVYRLREEFRLEHNRQGAIARSDWPVYRPKWAEYTRLYRKATAPLGAEYVRLREAIRKAALSDVEWGKLARTPDALDTLFGNRGQLKLLDTVASVDTLTQLKALSLDNLVGAVIDPYEDWTGYTETDPNAVLTVAANQITFTGLQRQSACTVYADKGVAHFGATFQHLIDGRLTGQAGGDFTALCYVWGLANITLPNHTTDPMMGLYFMARPTTGNFHIYLMIDDGATDQEDATAQLALNTIRYFTIDKNATDTDCLIYTDAARTSLLDTLTVANGSTSFQYMHSAYARSGTDATATVSGDIYNLDLQEAGGTTEYITPTGGITPSGALGFKPSIFALGGLTPAATLVRKPFTNYTGALTPTGAMQKLAATSYTGALSLAGALVLKPQVIVSGAISAMGALVQRVAVIYAGAVTPTGSLGHAAAHILAGAITPTGSLVKSVSHTVTGALTPAGAIVLMITLTLVHYLAMKAKTIFKI